MAEKIEKTVFEDGEVIESMECEIGEDNNFIDPLEELEGVDE